MKMMKRWMENSRKKRYLSGFFRYCLVLVIIGLAVMFGTDAYVKVKAGKDILETKELERSLEEPNDLDKVDAILVLGAQVKSDGQPSLMLKERLDMGIQLYEAGVSDKIIMSGDHGQKDYDEVNTMKSYAIERGVPSECIFMDHAGFSTYDSMYRAKEIFQAENIIVVTQEYHLYRAVYDANALGLQAKGVACDTAVYRGDLYRKSREILARVKDVGYTIIKPEPALLGEVIPVSGNGDVTNDKNSI